MRILLVNDYGTPTGGAELAIFTLRDGLRRRGHDVRVFASSAASAGACSQADYSCFGTMSRFRTLLQSANPWAYWSLRRTLKEFSPEVVHLNLFLTQLSPLILPLLRRVPCLYHAHWNRPVCPVGTKTLPDSTTCRTPAGMVCYRNRCLPLRDWFPLMFQTYLWRRWRNVFKILIANSDSVKGLMTAEGFSPVEVIRYGIPEYAARPPLSLPPTVAFAGRLVRQKGVEVLVRAFASVITRIPEARLLLVGEGPEQDSLRSLTDRLGISGSVSFLGHLPRERCEVVLKDAWVQVVPSLYAEAYPLVAGEAMMRGTAVIGSDCGGIHEAVQHGRTGLLVPPGDDQALAESLIRLLQDREEAERMGREGRALALEKWSKAAFIDRFAQLYEELLQDRPDRSA